MSLNKTKIEWCDYTWNPVVGCRTGCYYCYAERINKRLSSCKTAEEREFLQQRINSDGALIIETYEMAKRMINSGNYKYLSIKK